MKILTRVNQFNRYKGTVAFKKGIQQRFAAKKSGKPSEVGFYFKQGNCTVERNVTNYNYRRALTYMLGKEEAQSVPELMQRFADVVKNPEDVPLKRILAYRLLQLMVHGHDFSAAPEQQGENEKQWQALNAENALYNGLEQATVAFLTEPALENVPKEVQLSRQHFNGLTEVEDIVPYYESSVVELLSQPEALSKEYFQRKLMKALLARFEGEPCNGLDAFRQKVALASQPEGKKPKSTRLHERYLKTRKEMRGGKGRIQFPPKKD